MQTDVISALWVNVWFGLFVHPFSHIHNIGHVNYNVMYSILRTH